jgi:FkbM family methyltransferase
MSTLTESAIGKITFARQVIRHFGMRKGAGILLRWKMGSAAFHVTAPGCEMPMTLRARTSDFPMFVQTFIEQQYAFRLQREPLTIVDAGANVGTASCYFASRFPRAKIIALEPDPSNYALLCTNVSHLPQVIAVHAALWSRAAPLELLIANRHKSQVEVKELGDATSGLQVAGVSVLDLLRKYELSFIDLLKIDVEGAERNILESSGAWIDRVGVIAIELHEQLAPDIKAVFEKATLSFPHRSVCGENLIVSRADDLRSRDSDALLGAEAGG